MECQGGEESPQPAKALLGGSWSFPSTGTTDRSPKSPAVAEGPEPAHPRWHPRGLLKPGALKGIALFSQAFWPLAPRLPPSPSLDGACRCVRGPGALPPREEGFPALKALCVGLRVGALV